MGVRVEFLNSTVLAKAMKCLSLRIVAMRSKENLHLQLPTAYLAMKTLLESVKLIMNS
jgi:hypothetical protein